MEKCLFVYNPNSGKCIIKKKETYIVKKLSEKYEVVVEHSKYCGNIREIVLAKGEDFDLVVGAGGDGTLNEIVDAIMHLEHKPKLGYIPSGTVNDVAHSLYISRNTKKAVKNILTGKVFKHDIMKVNDHYGIYICCAGLFTETSYATDQKVKKTMGKIAYMFHGIKCMFNAKAIHLKLEFDGGEVEGNYAIMLINNSRYTAGLKINRNANLSDGLVDIMMIENKKKKVNIITIFKTIFMFFRGIEHYFHRKNVHHLQLSSFKVTAEDNTVINLDGERVASGSIEVEVAREGLEIIVPKLNKLTKEIRHID